MASSSKQESKLPGRMGLCRLNSHLSGSLLVFRRKMSPVRKKKKRRDTQCGWKRDKRKMHKKFEARNHEKKGEDYAENQKITESRERRIK